MYVYSVGTIFCFIYVTVPRLGAADKLFLKITAVTAAIVLSSVVLCTSPFLDCKASASLTTVSSFRKLIWRNSKFMKKKKKEEEEEEKKMAFGVGQQDCVVKGVTAALPAAAGVNLL